MRLATKLYSMQLLFHNCLPYSFAYVYLVKSSENITRKKKQKSVNKGMYVNLRIFIAA